MMPHSPPPPTLLLFVASFLLLFPPTCPQAPRFNGVDSPSLSPLSPSTLNSHLSLNCRSVTYRPLTGVCTSYGTPYRQLYSSTNRAQFSYFSRHSNTRPANTHLPSARQISNLLAYSSRAPKHDARRLNMLAVIFAQFIDHTLVATPLNASEPFPIAVPRDDPHLSSVRSLTFFRSNRVRVSSTSRIERPQNALTSTLDLASVYGASDIRCAALREWRRGRMLVSAGDMLPLNGKRLSNAPSTSRALFVAGDHRANEHPVLTALHTLFVREHNAIADELRRRQPGWDDERLFWSARRVNIAQFQRIVYEEWLPAMVGRGMGAYGGYKRDVDGGISVEFAGAAFRVGHTMVGGEVRRVGRDGKAKGRFRLRDMFFAGRGLLNGEGVEEFLRGAMGQRARRVDLEVDDTLRNHLFRGVKGEVGFDLVAMNVQRCRDHACARYNALRALVGLRRVRRFEEISGDAGTSERLRRAYGHVDRVEAWPGLMAERHVRGGSMGETMVRLWRREFWRIRNGDRWFYKREGVIGKDLMGVGVGGRGTLRKMVLRNTRIAARELPKRMFFVD